MLLSRCFHAFIVVSASGLLAGAAAQAPPTRDWRPAERAVIGDFSRITSVAAASDRVFATSPSALLVWQPHFQRWEGPYLPPEPRMLERVFASLVDPLDNSLWLVRPDGWIHFEPELGLWQSGMSPAVQGLAFDLADPLGGLLLRTSSGWLQVPRGGLTAIRAGPPAQPLRPLSVSEVLRENPSLQAFASDILVDGRMREAQYTVAARSFDRLGWYLGTWGAGLLYLRDGSAFPARLSFGVVGERLGAVFSAPGGVWTVNERGPESFTGFTLVASDLSEFRRLVGPPATGLPFAQARQLIGVGRTLWAATDQGAARIDPGSGEIDLIGEGRGLPDRQALSIVARGGWIAVGTARGVVRITDSMDVIRVAPSFSDAAYAVGISADTTWVGTDLGLFYTVSRDGELLRPAGLEASPSFREPVIGITWLGTTLVALTPERVIWRAPGGGWSLSPIHSAQLGRLRSFVVEGPGLWLAGERGVGFARLDFPVERALLIGDLPGDPRGVAVDADYLWVATSAGLVRFLLSAVGR